MATSDETSPDSPDSPAPVRIRPPRRRFLGLALLAVYLPTLIGFFSDCPHCRRAWLWVWPTVPGAVAIEWVRYLVKFNWPGEVVAYAVSALATLGIVAAVIRLGRWGRGWLLFGVLLAFLWSCFAAFLAYSAIRG